jgi:DNA-binding response OmpR family regulator
MMISQYRERWSRSERVLVAAQEPGAFAPLAAELSRRGADVVAAAGIDEAAEAVRAGCFDAVYVAGRASPDATELLVRIMAGLPTPPKLMLVVEPAAAHRFADLLAVAEETMTFALSPARMADAAGIGFHRAAAVA